VRRQFYNVRSGINQILSLEMNDQVRQFVKQFLIEIESSMLNFCRERVADIEMPSQKLVVFAA